LDLTGLSHPSRIIRPKGPASPSQDTFLQKACEWLPSSRTLIAVPADSPSKNRRDIFLKDDLQAVL
jgi:hypothetical protein